MTSETYFQFPLCAFHYGKTWKERLNAIIAYGLAETGSKFWGKCSTAQRDEHLRRWVSQRFDVQGDLQKAILLGAEKIGVVKFCPKYMAENHHKLKIFQERFEARHGVDATVRLRRDLIFEARDEKGITPRELSILAAIYSIIGDKQGPVRITRDRILHRALGYKSKAVYNAEHLLRLDNAKPLSEWELRGTVKQLEERGFFCRATYGRRLTYYSNRMNKEDFKKALVELKTSQAISQFSRRLIDDEITNAIRNQRAAMRGKPPPAPNALPLVEKTIEFEP